MNVCLKVDCNYCSIIAGNNFVYFLLMTVARALGVLNFTPLNGKPIRIMFSYLDPAIRKSWAGNIFIKV